jgi:hypothetical protein
MVYIGHLPDPITDGDQSSAGKRAEDGLDLVLNHHNGGRVRPIRPSGSPRSTR